MPVDGCADDPDGRVETQMGRSRYSSGIGNQASLIHGLHAPRPRLGGRRSASRRRRGGARRTSQAACLRDHQEGQGQEVRQPSAGIEMREVSGRRLAVIAVVAVVLVVAAAGFLRGGSAKEARFALGPVKIAKTNIKTFDEPEFAIKFRYPQGFNAVDVRIGSSAGARPAAQKAIGLKGDNVVIRDPLQPPAPGDRGRLDADQARGGQAGQKLAARTRPSRPRSPRCRPWSTRRSTSSGPRTPAASCWSCSTGSPSTSSTAIHARPAQAAREGLRRGPGSIDTRP